MATDSGKVADPLLRLYALCAQASAAEDAELDRFLEPEYSAVLNHIIEFPDYREVFGKALINLVKFPGKISGDLVEYCMHELRWGEFKSMIISTKSHANDPREINIYNHILEAFEDDWDSEGYDRWVSENRS